MHPMVDIDADYRTTLKPLFFSLFFSKILSKLIGFSRQQLAEPQATYPFGISRGVFRNGPTSGRYAINVFVHSFAQILADLIEKDQ